MFSLPEQGRGPESGTRQGALLPGALLVLDIDGVLIDPNGSFQRAVAEAFSLRHPGHVWSDDHFEAFKRIGGFNNDFRLAAGAMVLAESEQMDRLWTTGPEGFPDLDARMAELEPEAQRLVQAAYASTKSFERPLVTLAELLAVPAQLTILTGRPPEELVLAWDVLGFELPAVCDSAPVFRKPEPAGLLLLADHFQARRVVFVGDTRDDALCLRRAQDQDPSRRYQFAGVGPARHLFLTDGDLEAESLPALLPVLKMAQTWADTP